MPSHGAEEDTREICPHEKIIDVDDGCALQHLQGYRLLCHVAVHY